MDAGRYIVHASAPPVGVAAGGGDGRCDRGIPDQGSLFVQGSKIDPAVSLEELEMTSLCMKTLEGISISSDKRESSGPARLWGASPFEDALEP